MFPCWLGVKFGNFLSLLGNFVVVTLHREEKKKKKAR